MKIRTKFTLGISLVALIMTVVFSTIVYTQLLRESYKFVDKELNVVAEAIFGDLDFRGSGQDRQLTQHSSYLIERYWLKILDNSDKVVFTSPLAEKFDIPARQDKSKYLISAKIPLSSLWIDPDDRHELKEVTDDTVKFRVRTLTKNRAEETYTILVAKPLLFLDLELYELITRLAVSLAATGLLIFLVSYFLAGGLLRPLTTINQDIKEIRDNSLDRRIILGRSRDELYTLSESLNQMFDRLQHSFQQQKEFIGNAAHELKSPLTVLMLGHEEMLAADPPETLGRELEKQLRTMHRLSKLVRNLLEISRLEQNETCAHEPINLCELTSQVLDDFHELLEARYITVTRDMAESSLPGDPEKLLRLLINLLDNAIKYNAVENGEIRITLRKQPDQLHLTIANTGPEIPAADLPKIFDQFYRVEKSRSQLFGGAGLGLTIVRRIIDLHGGNIAITSSDGWTTCSIVLPCHLESTSRKTL